MKATALSEISVAIPRVNAEEPRNMNDDLVIPEGAEFEVLAIIPIAIKRHTFQAVVIQAQPHTIPVAISATLFRIESDPVAYCVQGG